MIFFKLQTGFPWSYEIEKVCSEYVKLSLFIRFIVSERSVYILYLIACCFKQKRDRHSSLTSYDSETHALRVWLPWKRQAPLTMTRSGKRTARKRALKAVMAMVAAFIIMDWIFVLKNTTTVIPSVSFAFCKQLIFLSSSSTVSFWVISFWL